MAPSNPLISHAGRRVLGVLGCFPLPHSAEFYTQKRKNQMTKKRIRNRLFQMLLEIETTSAVFDWIRWFAIMDSLQLVKE